MPAANRLDFLGEGVFEEEDDPKAPGTTQGFLGQMDDFTTSVTSLADRAVRTGNGTTTGTNLEMLPGETMAAYNARIAGQAASAGSIQNRTVSGGASYDPVSQQIAHDRGNIGGASGAYNATSDAGRAEYDLMRLERDQPFIAGGLRDEAREQDFFEWYDDNHQTLADDVVGGVNAVGGAISDGANAIADGIGNIFGGGGGAAPAGGGGYGAATAKAAIEDVSAEQDFTRQLGLDVLGGRLGGVNPNDKAQQLSELERVRTFLATPRAQQGVMGDVNSFLSTPRGPSVAELQLKTAQDDAMSDALSLARGTRGGAGARNRALRVAMSENAATQATGARDLALLRASEEQQRRDETLRALGLKGDLAGGVDSGTLNALGLSGELASNVRSQGLQERGQTLQAGTGLLGDALGSSTNIASTAIPTYLRDDLERDRLGYELTPDQKLLFAGLGAGSDLLSLFL